MINLRPTPARATQAAAKKLPRWALYLLLAGFALPGLFGREPWSDDAVGFGVMWTMFGGGPQDWWLLNVAGAPLAEEGPLAYWIGAAAMRAFAAIGGGGVDLVLASRMLCVVAIALATTALWYATYRFARRDAAQPVALAFGGQATPRDYGRMIADIGVLLFIATLGPVQTLHETTAETLVIALAAVVVFGLAIALDRPWRGALICGLAIGMIALARGPVIAAGPWLGVVIGFAAARGRRAVGPALLTTALAIACFAVWPLFAYDVAPAAAPAYIDAWRHWLEATSGTIGAADLIWAARNLPWYLWPLWPLAAWSLYAWRHQLGAGHIALPAASVAGVAAVSLVASPTSADVFVCAIPGLVVLAAFGATTLRRAIESLIDWFAVAIFSLALLFVWSYYVAMITGQPRPMAASVARLTPGFEPHIVPLALTAALIATVAWILVARWRIVRRPQPLWRGAVLSASGLVALWVTLNALFLAPVDFSRSHASLARRLHTELALRHALQGCVQAHRIAPSYRALLAYYGPLRFGRDDSPESCPYAIHRDSARSSLDDEPPPGRAGTWRLVWQGQRPTRPDETWRLWERTTQ